MILRWIYKIPFAFMSGLSMLLFATTMVYWNFRPDVNFLLTKQDVVFNPVWRTMFYFHLAGGMLAIGLGPLQFINKLRINSPSIHRYVGKIYVFAVLFLGSTTGLFMSFYANGGQLASVGFVIMSVLWFYTTFMGLQTIRKGQADKHRWWMIRSYALTFSAVTLRLWVPILSFYSNLEPLTIAILTAWISWLGNLTFVEIWISIKSKQHLNN